jgi:hypothetical protein
MAPVACRSALAAALVVALLAYSAASASASASASPAFATRGTFSCQAATAANEIPTPPPIWDHPGGRPPSSAEVALASRIKPLCPAGQVASRIATSGVAVPDITPPHAHATLGGLGVPSALETSTDPGRASAPCAGEGENGGCQCIKSGCYWWAENRVPEKAATGMEYETDISEPHVSSFAGAHSIDQLWVGAGGPYDEKYTFEIGWDVDPGMWGSSPAPHFFIFVNPDEYGSESAYDPTSFVPVGEPRIVPGETLTPETSAYRFGVEYRGGNWWIWAANQWIGYVRGSAWGNHFTKAESEADYGEVFDSGENPTTQMGDGQPGASAGATWMSQAVVIRKEGVEETTGYHGSASDPSLYSLGDCNTGKCEPATTLWHFGGSGIPDPPPSVVTEAATGIQESQATLHGSVNPNGLDTHYHFQYGTTTAYGSTTPEVDAGKGTSPVAESASISNLEPGATYHFRILASNADGTSYGNDLSFRVLTPPSMTIANGKIVAFTGDTSSALYATTSDFVQNTWQSTSVEPASTAYSAASAVTGPGGEIWSAFEGPGNTLWVGLDRASGGWGVSYESPANGTTYSAPSTVVDTNKNLWVAAEGPNHTLNLAEYTYASPKKWVLSTPVTAADVYSAPSAVAGPGGEVWIAFEGPSNSLWVVLQRPNGEAGVVYEGASNTTYSAPSTTIASGKYVWVAAEGPNHTLDLAEYSLSNGWVTSTPVSGADVYSAPSMAAGPGGELWIAFQGPGSTLWDGVRFTSGTWSTSYESPTEGTTYSAPSEVIDSEGNVWVAAQGAGDTLDVTVRLKSTGAWTGSYQGG